ncbi:type II toxin-antitoxin system VapC family toxin [Geomonas sp. Red32]|uniref:PIN domain-containing protein n=1 Tax=Geomonas sp. Red32 TaxID=2912856 RepID=UPI00202CFAF8|nr:type II toxin-antitoxin system VapC family toxin [Geomonas sp. Red32]
MKSAFIDTNLFIRYLTNDHPDKADRVERLLRDAAAGGIKLVTVEMVIAEVVWVLESSYGLTSVEVAPLIRGILATEGLEVINGALVANALDNYEGKNIDFIDGYLVAAMESRSVCDLYSFDRKHINRIKTITRREP